MRSLRLLTVIVLAAVVTLVAGCTSADDASAPTTSSSTSTSTSSTTTTVPAPRPRQFTVTGSRSGFAHGFELVRRESPADVEADLDLMASSGAEWLRVGLSWAAVEPSPGVYDWAGTDRVVHGAADRGMSVLVAVSSAPRWDAKPGCQGNECAPNDPQPYADFVRVAVQRYAPLGVHTWEIWNEPNHVQFWSPRPDPVAYTDLLTRTSRAIHQEDPDAIVMNGGLSPAPDRNGEIAPLTFLRRVYELGGGPYMGAVADHPYQYPNRPTSSESTNAFLQTAAIHDLMVSFGDGSKLIWGTEVGAPTRGPRTVSEANQPMWVHEYYDVWNGWAFTGPLLWYTARDKGDGNDVEDSYGLVRHNRTPKPAWSTFVDMVSNSALLPDAMVNRLGEGG